MDEYRSPVTIIIDDHVPDNKIDPQVMAKVMACGLTDVVVKEDIGVIEGIICTSKLGDLSHLDGVGYVRVETAYHCSDVPQAEDVDVD